MVDQFGRLEPANRLAGALERPRQRRLSEDLVRSDDDGSFEYMERSVCRVAIYVWSSIWNMT
jgi:hypothetical protein